MSIKEYLPKSLLGRAILIIVTPLILLQLISGLIFYETHWERVSYRLARSVSGDISAMISLLRTMPASADHEASFQEAAARMDLSLTFSAGEILSNAPTLPSDDEVEPFLAQTLRELVRYPFRIDTRDIEEHVVVDVQLPDGVLRFVVARKRLFSSTVYVFVLWMVGSSLILFGVATIFMRNQVRPIRRLASAADSFGKGRDVANFKPEGAREVRQAAHAFIAMRDRIDRYLRQRTDMLSGVSHDLRTPLTRMKLQLELAGATDDVNDLKADVAEMERMLEGYLSFARGEGSEEKVVTDLNGLLEGAAQQWRRRGGKIDFHVEEPIEIALQPNAFRRCIDNLLSNAARYGENVSLRAGRRGEAVEITVDDDGPGIPQDQRDEVFRPFVRLEGSRNPATGGVGLGLTIVRDIVRGHGGDITLQTSPAGGLRARLRLPD